MIERTAEWLNKGSLYYYYFFFCFTTSIWPTQIVKMWRNTPEKSVILKSEMERRDGGLVF